MSSSSPYVTGYKGGAAPGSPCEVIGLGLVIVGLGLVIVGALALIYYSCEVAEYFYSDAGANRFASSTSQVGAGDRWRTWTGTGPHPRENMMGAPLRVHSHRKDGFLGGVSVKSDPHVGHSPAISEDELRSVLSH